MDNQVTSVLKNLGFEEREVKIYLSLMVKSSLTAMQISKETKIDRTTTYDILERLINKGIVSSFIKNKSKHFIALSPNKLLIYFKEKYFSFQDILPKLNELTSKTQELVKCELFQGKEGLKTVLKDLIESKKEYKVIGIRKEYENILKYFNEQGIIKLDQEKIKEIGIYSKGEKFKKLKYGRYKEINQKLSPMTTLIYENKVVFFVWIEPYSAILIENETFRKCQEEYFNLLWASSVF
jgi:sugar-specific transcriptional regulator TrmB